MAIEFKLPDLGEDIEEAEVIGILVKEGDTVVEEQGLIEIETEKANVEVPSPAAGTVKAINVKIGDTIKTGQLIATIEPSAAAAPARNGAPPTERPAPASTPAAAAREAPPADAAPAVAAPPAAPAAVELPSEPRAAPAESERPEPTPPARDGRAPVPAAPSVRQFARDIGVDIEAVTGSGPGGRVSLDDVKAHARVAASRPAAAAGLAPRPLPDFSRYGETTRERLNSVRRTVAREMTQSWTTIPHVTLYAKADVTDLDEARRRHRERVERAGGSLTMLPILVTIVSAALRRFPAINASIDVETQELVHKDFVNIGFATDTERGLVVPVIRDADRKSITQLAIELAQLSEKARAGKLSLEELRGGTFTISNLGGLGIGFFTPLIHLPESAILGVGRAEWEPVWDGSAFKPRFRMPLSLAHDHRVTDGADGARFLAWVVQALQDPLLISLE